MLKYVDVKIVMAEVPNEITLAINISNCPCHCEGCHSSYLEKDIGELLTSSSLEELINSNTGISCVAFMGGDSHPSEINNLAKRIKELHKNLKVAWYSGRSYISKDIEPQYFNFIKIGPYKKDCGPLTESTTNQRFYRIDKDDVGGYTLIDITSSFYDKNI